MSWNRVKPENRAQARIWNKYNSWDWYPIKIWPRFLAKAAITQNLTQQARFSLLMYLVGNGMGPEMAAGAIYDIGGAKLDMQAKSQIAWLVRNLKTLEVYKYYDEVFRKWVPFSYIGDDEAKSRIQVRKRIQVDDAVIVPQYKESWAMINKEYPPEEKKRRRSDPWIETINF